MQPVRVARTKHRLVAHLRRVTVVAPLMSETNLKAESLAGTVCNRLIMTDQPFSQVPENRTDNSYLTLTLCPPQYCLTPSNADPYNRPYAGLLSVFIGIRIADTQSQ